MRIGIIGEPLWMRDWTSGFHKPWTQLIILQVLLQVEAVYVVLLQKIKFLNVKVKKTISKYICDKLYRSFTGWIIFSWAQWNPLDLPQVATWNVWLGVFVAHNKMHTVDISNSTPGVSRGETSAGHQECGPASTSGAPRRANAKFHFQRYAFLLSNSKLFRD